MFRVYIYSCWWSSILRLNTKNNHTKSYRIQCGNGQLQELEVPSVGSRRSDEHQVNSLHHWYALRIVFYLRNVLIDDLDSMLIKRPYWRCYYSNTDAIVYVVDSMDRDRIGISKTELFAMLEVSSFGVFTIETEDLLSNERHIIQTMMTLSRKRSSRTPCCACSPTSKT